MRRAAGGDAGSGREGTVRCDLCPRHCVIPPNHAGDCRVRINWKGELRAVTYGRPCAVHVDPVEKKPLFHVLPGQKILSLATAGCNLHCRNCQNASISQANPEDVRVLSWSRTEVGLSPRRLVEIAVSRRIPMVAYTYTEPVVFYEYTYETCVEARRHGLKNVTVTAGYINEKPLRRLAKVVDASNVDIKTMNPEFFRVNSGGELKYVLDGLVVAKEEGVWIEVTNLIIPTMNDSPEETRRLCRWVRKYLGPDTPLHISRFYPHHQLRNLPPTPVRTLLRAREIALAEGLHYVYVGNVRGRDEDFENTFCPKCKEVVIRRYGFAVLENKLEDGRCPRCQTPIPGIWK